MTILEEIREFVVSTYLFGDRSRLQDSTSFLETGIVDSTGILELVEHLENRYVIQILTEEMLPENLDSVAAAAAFVMRKLDGRSRAVAV